MARKALQPVSVAGIEFDALIDEQKTLSATIPAYPVENGFPVSDAIILDPVSIQMTLYVTNTPVTWLYRHGSNTDRVSQICEQIEQLWLDKKLIKVVTTDAIYTDMGITSISIKKSREIGYAREITLQMQKVEITERKVADIPSYSLKSGTTMANAGSASVSQTSSKSSAGGTGASGGTGNAGSSGSSNGSNSSGGSSGSKSSSKKGQSVLYGVATGLGFI